MLIVLTLLSLIVGQTDQRCVISTSMQPTLVEGDYMALDFRAFGLPIWPFNAPLSTELPRLKPIRAQYGDIVTFRNGTNNELFVKRIIGLPGDRMRIVGGLPIINGRAVSRERSSPYPLGGKSIKRLVEGLPNGHRHFVLNRTQNGKYDTMSEVTVPEGHYFVLGDNRDDSLDSRATEVGFVPQSKLRGKVLLRYAATKGSCSLWQVWRWGETFDAGRSFSAIDPR